MRSITLRGGLAEAELAITFLPPHPSPTAEAQQAPLAVGRALAAKGEWDAGTTYAKDDIVTARGSSWISLRASNLNKVPGQTSPSTAAYWQLFARGFNPAGAWSSATKYQPDDLVTQNGQTYRAKITNQNRTPNHPTIWELLATKGAAGATGAQGPQGPAGPNTGISAGTSTAPGISFAGDSGTGIYSPAAGKIALSENSTTVLHFKSDNTALGNGALGAATPGTGNTAVGKNALASGSETGNNNTAVGEGALFSTQDGARNTAVGYNALTANSSGQSNTAVGANALQSNAAFGNVAIGDRALQSNLFGGTNTAVGTTALQANVNDGNNTAVGYNALNAATAIDNTAVGFNALHAATTGGDNTAIGAAALNSNTTGESNIALGVSAAAANTTGTNNTALGTGALAGATSGSNNVGSARWLVSAPRRRTTASLSVITALWATTRRSRSAPRARKRRRSWPAFVA
jgi:hypothetical protein